MKRNKGTAFDRYLQKKMTDPEFADEYAKARAEIDEIDRIIQMLDEAREKSHLSKAELARRIDAPPEIIRRLFTSESPNPTMSTTVRIARALGFRLELVSVRKGMKRPLARKEDLRKRSRRNAARSA